MDEDAKRAPHQPHGPVHEPQTAPHQEPVARKAQNERVPGKSRCDTRQPYAIRGAADDAVQDDDVGGLDPVRALEHILDAKRRAALEPFLPCKLERVRLVGGDELDDLAGVRSGLEQLGLNRSDSTSDLEHAGSVEPFC